MAVKTKALYSIDTSILTDFQRICNEKKETYSETLEALMKDYIAKRGELMFDEIYAPRIEGLVKRTMQNEIDRVMSMLYYIRRDTVATLTMLPAIYKKQIISFENTLVDFIKVDLLNDNPESKGNSFNAAKQWIDSGRQNAMKEIKQAKRDSTEHKAI